MSTGGAEPATVYVVDDDDAVRASLELLLRSAGHRVHGFASAAEFMDGGPPGAGCLLLDLRMPGMSGLDVQAELHARGDALPVIFISGHGDVAAASRALRAGAVDFVEKPYDATTLLERIDEALQRDREERRRRTRRAELLARLDTLTPREREVLDGVAAGAASKVIAADLGISERTVELHRARAMKKMAARSPAELVRELLAEPDFMKTQGDR